MNTLACPLPAQCKEAWRPYCGTWYFSIYDDYRLTLRETRRGLSVRLKDLDWDWNDEELTLIRASEEQLVLSLYSFRLCARLRIYPNAARQALIVEFTENEHYERCAPLLVEPSHEFRFYPQHADPPEWALGTWKNADFGFLRLSKADEGGFALAVWSDWGEKPPTKTKRHYRRILAMPTATEQYLEFVWQGANDLNLRHESTLRYDFLRQRLQYEYTRRELASRQRSNG